MVSTFTNFITWAPEVNLYATCLGSLVYWVTNFCELYHPIVLEVFTFVHIPYYQPVLIYFKKNNNNSLLIFPIFLSFNLIMQMWSCLTSAWNLLMTFHYFLDFSSWASELSMSGHHVMLCIFFIITTIFFSVFLQLDFVTISHHSLLLLFHMFFKMPRVHLVNFN